MKQIYSPIYVSLSFLVFFFVCFNLLQNETVYTKTLGLVTKTYNKTENIITLDRSSFTGLTNKKFIKWDGVHFKQIRDRGYQNAELNTPYLYAFFPLFPAIWRLSQLPPLGILFLNYLFFWIGFVLLLKAFDVQKKHYTTYSLIVLCIPSFIVFMLPYSEALFMLLISIGIYGLMKKRKWLFFASFLLASVTRPAYTVLLISMVCTEVLFLLRYNDFKFFAKSLFFKTLPIVIGTGIVGLIQQFYSPGPPYFKFFHAYDYWGREFEVPFQLVDWSHEGFGMSISAIIMICLPLLSTLVYLTNRVLFKSRAPKVDIGLLQEYSTKSYITILSMTYLVGIFFINFFFQDGSINGLSRYILNAPFLIVLVLNLSEFNKNSSSLFKVFAITLAFISIYIEIVSSFSYKWSFVDLGCVIGTVLVLLVLFMGNMHLKVYKTLLYATVVLNVIWSTFLLHSYLIEAWIFT